MYQQKDINMQKQIVIKNVQKYDSDRIATKGIIKLFPAPAETAKVFRYSSGEIIPYNFLLPEDLLGDGETMDPYIISTNEYMTDNEEIHFTIHGKLESGIIRGRDEDFYYIGSKYVDGKVLIKDCFKILVYPENIGRDIIQYLTHKGITEGQDLFIECLPTRCAGCGDNFKLTSCREQHCSIYAKNSVIKIVNEFIVILPKVAPIKKEDFYSYGKSLGLEYSDLDKLMSLAKRCE